MLITIIAPAWLVYLLTGIALIALILNGVRFHFEHQLRQAEKDAAKDLADTHRHLQQ